MLFRLNDEERRMRRLTEGNENIPYGVCGGQGAGVAVIFTIESKTKRTRALPIAVMVDYVLVENF